MEKRILVNAIMAMDGTILQSHHRHDYKSYTCVIEEVEYTCSVDGGYDYLKRNGKYTEMSLFEGDAFAAVRLLLCRGGRGKESKDPITYIPLCKINDEWLDALIEYEDKNRPKNMFLPYYIMEKIFRKHYEKI